MATRRNICLACNGPIHLRLPLAPDCHRSLSLDKSAGMNDFDRFADVPPADRVPTGQKSLKAKGQMLGARVGQANKPARGITPAVAAPCHRLPCAFDERNLHAVGLMRASQKVQVLEAHPVLPSLMRWFPRVGTAVNASPILRVHFPFPLVTRASGIVFPQRLVFFAQGALRALSREDQPSTEASASADAIRLTLLIRNVTASTHSSSSGNFSSLSAWFARASTA